MVLHDISDDTELVKVSTTTLCSEWFLERDLDIIDVIAVPGCTEELVTESQNQYVFHHLFAQIMIDTENLLFLPVWLKGPLQLSRTGKVFSEWLLDLEFFLEFGMVRKARDVR
jgi:hypothetical protein